MDSFPTFDKIPRLTRDITITEKLDGTNALVSVQEVAEGEQLNIFDTYVQVDGEIRCVRAGSRSRWLDPHTKGGDNFGFAKWVRDNAEDLVNLGVGLHYGEWWGQGIQRTYGLKHRVFSLFNTKRWYLVRPASCSVVPVLYQGPYTTEAVYETLLDLAVHGSKPVQAQGFKDAEGIVIFHSASQTYFKKTLDNDGRGKYVSREV